MSTVEMLDSRTELTISPNAVYLDSRPDDQAAPSGTGYPLVPCPGQHPGSRVISGIYYVSSQQEEWSAEEAQLAAEFQAWDALSDEAIEVFERQIRETKS